jgi:RNA polymerase sigma-70 factor (ECF subfamily)
VLAELFQDDLKTLRTYRGRAKLSTWLAVITRRVTIRTLTAIGGRGERQPGSDCDLEQIAAPSERSSLSGELDCREIVLQHCLRQLSEPDRLVLKLHFEERLSYDQIGRQLGMSANAVGPKLSRAQKRLKKLVAKYRPQDPNREERK